jgi:hypothetical protein
MTRESLVRLALHAYPKGVRRARGEEMLATVLDSSYGSRRAYGREIAGLIAGGLRARVGAGSQSGATRVIADGFCYGGAGMLALTVSQLVGVNTRLAAHGADSTQLWWLLLLGASFLAAAIGYDRVAAAGALSWLVIVVAAPFRGPDLLPLVAFAAVPAACFAVMAAAPRHRPPRLRRALWLLPVAALGLAAGGAGGRSYLLLAPLAVIVPVALARLPRDPRLAIGCSLFAAEIAMFETAQVLAHRPLPLGLPLTLVLFSAAPIAIAFAAVRPRLPRAGEGA